MSVQNTANKLDYYSKFKLGMAPLSLSLFLYLMIVDPWQLLFSNWFIDLVFISNFFGGQASGASYGGRCLDAIQPKPRAGLGERVGMIIGVSGAVVISVLLAVFKATVPFGKTLHAGAYVLRGLGLIGAAGGVGNRLGQNIDNGGRPDREKSAMGIAAILGLIGGTLLYVFGVSAAVTIFGISTFFSGGLTIPILAGIIFATTFSNTCASSTDYVSKAYTYVDSETSQDPIVKKTVKERFNEYRMALAGVSTGVIVGAVVIAAILISQPYLFVGVAGLFAAVMVMASCVSIFGAIFSRGGRLKDVLQKRKAALQEEAAVKLSANPESTAAINARTSAPKLGASLNALTADKKEEPVATHHSDSAVCDGVSARVLPKLSVTTGMSVAEVKSSISLQPSNKIPQQPF